MSLLFFISHPITTFLNDSLVASGCITAKEAENCICTFFYFASAYCTLRPSWFTICMGRLGFTAHYPLSRKTNMQYQISISRLMTPLFSLWVKNWFSMWKLMLLLFTVKKAQSSVFSCTSCIVGPADHWHFFYSAGPGVPGQAIGPGFRKSIRV